MPALLVAGSAYPDDPSFYSSPLNLLGIYIIWIFPLLLFLAFVIGVVARVCAYKQFTVQPWISRSLKIIDITAAVYSVLFVVLFISAQYL